MAKMKINEYILIGGSSHKLRVTVTPVHHWISYREYNRSVGIVSWEMYYTRVACIRKFLENKNQ